MTKQVSYVEGSSQYLFPKDGYDLAVYTNSMAAAECAGKTYKTVFCDLKQYQIIFPSCRPTILPIKPILFTYNVHTIASNT
jgi:hypothetical protein